MYAVEVRDHIMIAHSFKGEMFGPAQALHGATFVVDIGRAIDELKAILKPLNYQNLDALPQFKGMQTTTETLSRYVFDKMVEALKKGALGEESNGVTRIRVSLHESHVARAWFEGPVSA
jgi:6-pyruvoyl-tetrahydropterin synthase